jgi:ATP-dependent protease ClpP protease subunit
MFFTQRSIRRWLRAGRGLGLGVACLALLAGCASTAPQGPVALGSTWLWEPTAVVVSDAQVSDHLRVRRVQRVDAACAGGVREHLEAAGTINADTSYLLARALSALQPCVKNGVAQAPRVYLSSAGGQLEDGLAIGRMLRQANADVRVMGNQRCASACAIAFVGGQTRVLHDYATLRFHAPYLNQRDGLTCKLPDAQRALRVYYEEMLPRDIAAVLYQRTLSVCSTTDGWTVNADAAAMYGLTTPLV